MVAAQGDWVHVYRMLFDHPKAKRLGKRLGLDPAAAAGYLICLWTWSMSIAPDGDLTRFDPEEIEAAAGWGGEDGAFISAATECRWLDRTKRGLVIHDWNDWAGTMVAKRAKERQRSADRRAAARSEEDDRAPTARRPREDRGATDGRPLAEREKREKREEEPPLPPQPVHNSADQERVGSFEPEEQSKAPPTVAASDMSDASHPPSTSKGDTCDGAPCVIREFPAPAFAPLRRAMLASKHPEQQEGVGKGGDLDALLSSYAAHVCAACQASLSEFARPQRDALCERAVVAAVENLHGAHDVAAVMRSRLQRFGLLELVGDAMLTELRRTRRDRRRKGELRPISEVLHGPREVAL